jgi:hypothetical protein
MAGHKLADYVYKFIEEFPPDTEALDSEDERDRKGASGLENNDKRKGEGNDGEGKCYEKSESELEEDRDGAASNRKNASSSKKRVCACYCLVHHSFIFCVAY